MRGQQLPFLIMLIITFVSVGCSARETFPITEVFDFDAVTFTSLRVVKGNGTEKSTSDAERISSILSAVKECSVMDHKPVDSLPVGFNYMLSLFSEDLTMTVSAAEISIQTVSGREIYDVIRRDQEKLLRALENLFDSIARDH